jgi:hypothetical protein
MWIYSPFVYLMSQLAHYCVYHPALIMIVLKGMISKQNG